MWSSINKDSIPVSLLQPIHSPTNNTSSCTSTILGGRPCYYPDDDEHALHKTSHEEGKTPPKCSVCGSALFLLVQLYAPMDQPDGSSVLDRTLYVFGCNRASCDNKEGSFQCLRSQSLRQNDKQIKQQQQQEELEQKEIATKKEESDPWGNDNDNEWGDGFDDDNNIDDWMGGDNNNDKNDDDDGGLEDLEKMLSACEMQTNRKTTKKKKPATQRKKKNDTPTINGNTSNDDAASNNTNTFSSFELEWFDEPNDEHNNANNNVDNNNNASIQKMLDRYLDTEDDVELVSTLKQQQQPPSSSSNNKVSKDLVEKEERVPAALKTFLNFYNRIKRSPGQVVRYAYGGEPMWSKPPPSNQSKKKEAPKRQKGNHKKQPQSHLSKPPPSFPNVPNCKCGSKREFEFQLMPSILHVLHVDQYIRNTTTTSCSSSGLDSSMNSGGMNWGVLAVYSCSISCTKYRDEYVVVQDSVDGTPVLKKEKDGGGSVVPYQPDDDDGGEEHDGEDMQAGGDDVEEEL